MIERRSLASEKSDRERRIIVQFGMARKGHSQLEVFVNKLLMSLLKTGIYWLEQTDRATADLRGLVKDRVEDLTERVGEAIRGQEDHTIRNTICFAAASALASESECCWHQRVEKKPADR